MVVKVALPPGHKVKSCSGVAVVLVKTVRFVDLTDLPDSNPWNIDAGEVLNYWAPALLSEWLESSTQGAVCCNNC